MAIPQSQLIQFDISESSLTSTGYHTSTTFDFLSSPPFTDPLLPPEHQWPTFDSASLYTPSPPDSTASSCHSSPSPPADGVLSAESEQFFPSSAMLASIPIPFSRTSSRNRSPNHVPRPRNAFMLFRSAFAAAQKITTNIEHDSRHITRIIAHCWNRLSESEKQVWRDKAAAEKALHALRYPNYRFTPIGRAQKPVKRNVKRNGVEDKKRCEQVAELLLAGKQGHDLENAVKQIRVPPSGAEQADWERYDNRPVADDAAATSAQRWQPRKEDPEDCNIQPFRSPLLPPAKLLSKASASTTHEHATQYDTVQVTQPFPIVDTTPSFPAYAEHCYTPPDARQSAHTPQMYPIIYQDHYALSSISPKTLTFSNLQYSPFQDYLDRDTNSVSPPDFSAFSWNTPASTPTTHQSPSSFHGFI